MIAAAVLLWKYRALHNGRRLTLYIRGYLLAPCVKGGLLMSTNKVLQLCLVIIGICSLFIQAYKKK